MEWVERKMKVKTKGFTKRIKKIDQPNYPRIGLVVKPRLMNFFPHLITHSKSFYVLFTPLDSQMNGVIESQEFRAIHRPSNS